MQVHFTPPPVVPSPLARLDARWRLAALLLLMVATAAVRSLPAAALALAAALGVAAVGRVPMAWYLQRLAVVGGLIALFVVPAPLLGGADWAEGLALAGVILSKSLALFTLACVLLTAAPLEASLKAARSLRVPGLLVHIALLSYRYLFVLGDELARLRVALRTRGFRNRPNLHSWRTVGAAAGTLLVRGHDRAERVATAMRCRGFDGTFRALAESRTSAGDIITLGLLLAVAAGLVALDVAAR